MDVASMCETSTKVFILEVMGRHAGWIAAARGNGYPDVESLWRRAGVHPDTLERLAEADAFAETGLSEGDGESDEEGDTLGETEDEPIASNPIVTADANRLRTDAALVDGKEASDTIERLFADPEVAYIHAHYATRGCFAARIDRA